MQHVDDIVRAVQAGTSFTPTRAQVAEAIFATADVRLENNLGAQVANVETSNLDPRAIAKKLGERHGLKLSLDARPGRMFADNDGRPSDDAKKAAADLAWGHKTPAAT